MNTTVTSKQFSWNSKDFLKGLLMAIGAPVFTIIIQSINAGSLTFNWKAIITTALSAGLMYLSKNFFDTPKVVGTNPSPAEVSAIKEGTAQITVIPK